MEFSEEQNTQRFFGDGEYNLSYNGKEGEEAAKELKSEIEQDRLEAYEKYMPIGSIVSIDGEQKLMIIGYKSKNGDVESDYLACQFPFGIDMTHGAIAFNHEMIKKVYDLGYINAQGKYYRSQLSDQQKPEINGPRL